MLDEETDQVGLCQGGYQVHGSLGIDYLDELLQSGSGGMADVPGGTERAIIRKDELSFSTKILSVSPGIVPGTVNDFLSFWAVHVGLISSTPIPILLHLPLRSLPSRYMEQLQYIHSQ